MYTRVQYYVYIYGGKVYDSLGDKNKNRLYEKEIGTARKRRGKSSECHNSRTKTSAICTLEKKVNVTKWNLKKIVRGHNILNILHAEYDAVRVHEIIP